MRLAALFLIALLGFFSRPVFAQQPKDKANNLVAKLNKLSQNAPTELIYLQANKDVYEAGEDLWFKADVLNSQTLVPSILSRTLYLQLLEEKSNAVVWQEKYVTANGRTAGHIYLRDSLSEGNYFFRAYTPGSVYNGTVEYKAIRKIKIIKDFKSIVSFTSSLKPQALSTVKNIQFNTFPEGGRLINGIPSRLAFKAVDTAGFPLAVSGTLFENDQALHVFNTTHAGMGSLFFTPIVGKTYTIRLKDTGTDSIFRLPEIAAEGISLRLAGRDSTHLEFVVSQPAGSKEKTVYLRGQLRGITACLAWGVLNKELKIRIPLSEFTQQGIAAFTVFNEEMLPVAERLVYVQPRKKLYIKAELSKQHYGRREKGILKIKTTDENGMPIKANLGISIFDKLNSNKMAQNNILSYVYLSSQLRGRIYNPAFYFDEKNEGREEAMEVLLLTQGWSNYVWDEANLEAYRKDKDLALTDDIRGTVNFTKRLKQAPKNEQLIMAFSPDENGRPANNTLIQADSMGKFLINPEIFKGSDSYIYIRPMGPAEFGPTIRLEDPFAILNKRLKSKKTNDDLFPMASLATENHEEVLSLESRMVRLREVEIKARGVQGFRDKYIGYLDSLAKLKMNFDYLGIPCGVLNCFNHKKDRSKKPVDGKLYVVLLGKNGEILGPDYNLNYYFGEGKMVYHYPKISEKDLLEQNNLSRTKSYYPQREFYTPNYDKELKEDLLPDARNALLWAPSVTTDEKGEAIINFFCSDITSVFIAEMEGVSLDGLLGRKRLTFSVLKNP